MKSLQSGMYIINILMGSLSSRRRKRSSLYRM